MKTRVFIIIIAVVSLGWLVGSTTLRPAEQLVNHSTKAWQEVADRTAQLQHNLGQQNVDWTTAEENFAQIRMSFKECEALLWYVNRQYTNQFLNGAPLPFLEENSPQLSVMQPQGLQRLEELISERDAAGSQQMLSQFSKSWNELEEPMVQVVLTDRMVLEALRQEIIRIAFLEITGFENPAFTDAIDEAELAWMALSPVLHEYVVQVDDHTLQISVNQSLEVGRELLASGEFDTFDRLTFIREAAQPLYAALVDIQQAMGIEWYDETGQLPKPVNDRARYLFSTDLLDPYYFTALVEENDNDQLRELGQFLFFDPILSDNNERSCASCHNPSKAFTDGVPLSVAMNFEGTVDRNAPVLINAVYAESFFYDLRTTPLENQFEHVVFNHKEFNSSYAEIVNSVESIYGIQGIV